MYCLSHVLLIFSWSDTCWECRIWRVDTYRFCSEYGTRKLFRRSS